MTVPRSIPVVSGALVVSFITASTTSLTFLGRFFVVVPPLAFGTFLFSLVGPVPLTTITLFTVSPVSPFPLTLVLVVIIVSVPSG